MKRVDIKLFVPYKQRHKVIESDVIIPVQTGRAIADEIFEEMIGDNEGENISEKNDKYSELTLQYWVWKNYEMIGAPEYVGFMHHRRHFIFNDKPYSTDIEGCVPFKNIDKSYLSRINLNENDIKRFVEGYDCVTTKEDLQEISKRRRDPQWGTAKGSWNAIIDLDPRAHEAAMETLIQLYPDYKSAVEHYLQSCTMHWYNSYVMTREFFFEYCQFLFPILSVLETKLETRYYSKNAQRIFGYIAERLHTVFIIKKQQEGKKIRYANLTVIKDMREDKEKKILPIYPEKNVIVLGSSKSYIIYAIVAIQSIIACASPEKNYDIVLLNDASALYYDYILKKMNIPRNISVRRYNPEEYVQQLDLQKIKLWDRLSIVTFFRLACPEIFEQYEKVLYIDSDMVAVEDVYKLFQFDMHGAPIAAVKDFETQRILNKERMNGNKEITNYFLNLGINKLDDYFNGGLLLFDVKKCLQIGYPEKYKLKLQQTGKLILADQDILNSIFNENYCQLPAEWNVCWQVPVNSNNFYKRQLPCSMYEEYENSRSNPKVIHYCGRFKPWSTPDMELADWWWFYARMSPVYECILHRSLHCQVNYSIIASSLQKGKIYYKYFIHKILRHIKLSKRRREKHLEKERFYKQKYKQIKTFIKTYSNVF